MQPSLSDDLANIDFSITHSKVEIIDDIKTLLQKYNLTVVDVNTEKPWGGFVRLDYADGDKFVGEFFSDINPKEARLGREQASLSPKILLVEPGQRLSWQYHDRRAERWKFLTDGLFCKSETDEPGQIFEANTGEWVQFECGERHRLIGSEGSYTVVAEIWQHVDPDSLSDEDDIVRLQDDYQR